LHPGSLREERSARHRAGPPPARRRGRARVREPGALHAPVGRCRQRRRPGLLWTPGLHRAQRADPVARRRAIRGAGTMKRIAALLLLCATAASADRAPVLQQIKVPHDYYYREMYLPQLTSGPSGLAWSPDSSWLVYSMSGSLWKKRLGANEAQEITDGPGYDYQPDWSPDGKRIVFVRYLNDAMNLYTLDVDSGRVLALTTGHDVNLEPRWSPDGKHLAYVSTKGTGHFHIFVDGKQWSAERKSRIARYYYSPFDQQLSPAWSPDSRSLVYVDNPETGYG